MEATDQEKEGSGTPPPDPKPASDPPPPASPDSKIWQDEPADTDDEPGDPGQQ